VIASYAGLSIRPASTRSKPMLIHDRMHGARGRDAHVAGTLPEQELPDCGRPLRGLSFNS